MMADAHDALVFSSIFPHSTTTHTTPTPRATPDPSFTAPGQVFGGPTSFGSLLSHTSAPPKSNRGHHVDARNLTAAQRAVQHNLAWSTATQFLSLRGAPVPWGYAKHGIVKRKADVEDALRWLLVESVGSGEMDGMRGTEELLEWFLEEVKEHFVGNISPTLRVDGKITSALDAREYLDHLAQRLGAVLDMYMMPMKNHVLVVMFESSADAQATAGFEQRCQQRLHSLIAQSANSPFYRSALALVFHKTGWDMFELGKGNPQPVSDPRSKTFTNASEVFDDLAGLLKALSRVGLGGDDGQRAFAVAVDSLIDDFVNSWHTRVDWYGRKSMVPLVWDWVNQGLARYVAEAMVFLSERGRSGAKDLINADEARQWREFATTRLGRARVSNLFDYVIRWDRSLGAMLDLKEYIVTPAARVHLTTSFSQQLQRRLLHAGATTIQILDTYIYVIRAFSELDPKGVLLDRVSRPLRRCLKERDDTTRIIIASLLADLESDDAAGLCQDVSIEVAKEMLSTSNASGADYDVDTDWNNMNWTPDPHDAGPEYKRSRSEDVISSLLSLYDMEDFTVELKNILGAHLLQRTTATSYDAPFELERETQLLELFKLRLGDEKLQACEVMLHDIEESHHIDHGIQSNPSFAVLRKKVAENGANGDVSLQSQILSSFFWPPLREDEFNVPNDVRILQEAYEHGFTALKEMRKLKWLTGLGRAVVELELRDRSVEVDCTSAQACVVHAFGAQDDEEELTRGKDSAVRRTVQGLMGQLQMDETLLRQSLAFWISQLVIRETRPGSDVFEVMETLESPSAAAAAAAVAPAAAIQAETVAAVKSSDDILMENMQLYRQFVIGMLTNGGKMDAPRMHMMLKMVVPGGFNFKIEDLRRLLERMGGEGLVRSEGDSWSVVK